MSDWLPRQQLQHLIDVLRGAGYHCVGPRVEDGAIVYGPIENEASLPRELRDRQAPGSYRLEAADGPRRFAWATGPQAVKPLAFAAREVLWQCRRDADGRLQFEAPAPAPTPTAIIGVRACDLAALAIQDRHFMEGRYPDPSYAARRRSLLLVAVHCTHPAATCFCASTGDGPEATTGFDLALHEQDAGYVVTAGSSAGEDILAHLGLEEAHPDTVAAARQEVRSAAEAQQRALPGRNLRDALFANLDHPRWKQVAERCLSCGNCTLVCPTCFCHREREEPELDGNLSRHLREWDSCFSTGHSALHGFNIRPETGQRYRQWLTHKLGSWHDQFGRSGCVGCGRCITWCPVGIDITEEATALCAADTGPGA
ncbi:MAG: 4Fe-4S dicluster domain-containing protein [Gammaproteobacteria bacterium]